MDLQLEGKVALVGGGSDGIGFGIAYALAAEGARVALMARRAPRLEQAAERILRGTGSEVLTIAADCSLAEDCSRAVAAVVDHFGALDILVNNDGGPPIGPICSFDDEAWQKALDRHLMYVVRMCREGVPHMRSRGGGSILNVVSVVALQPRVGFVLPVTTWAAVLGYSKTLSLEVAEDGINVNTILSGRIDTSRLDVVHGEGGPKDESLRADLAAGIPMRRIGTVEEFADLASLLVSPRGNFVTGTAIQIDGGMLVGLR